MKLCVHRPAGGEVSTLPSTPATERTVSHLKGGKLSGGALSVLPRLRRRSSPSCVRETARGISRIPEYPATRFRDDLRIRPDRKNSKKTSLFHSNVYARVYETERDISSKFVESECRTGDRRYSKISVKGEMHISERFLPLKRVINLDSLHRFLFFLRKEAGVTWCVSFFPT